MSQRGFPAQVDIAVIGAGAAGIAAARRLAASRRVSVLVLEARERVGGRTWTVDCNELPCDLGGEWLHSADRNVVAGLAKQQGFDIYHRRPDWTTRLRNSGASAAEEADWIAEREAFYWAVHRAARENEDRAAATVLRPGGRWNALFDATSTWANAVELDRLSVQDNNRYEDSGVNWRVCEGYGRLLTRLADSLPVAFGTAVSRIDHRRKAIRLETARGTVTAARAIVALPTSIVAEDLSFDPPLPEKQEAAAGLPLGLADKLFLRFSGQLPGIDSDAHLVGSTRRRETMSYQVRPFGRPVIQCFFGGDFAAGLERDGGMPVMAAFAADELAALYGNDIRRQLTPLAASGWRRDPFARGSYSYARPGHADDRTVLAAPVENRLFFAGEACSPNFFSTVHGAYMTGEAAADAALASLHRLSA
ncbi:MAG: FAD-dependent oxidoreductase [Alphaproteobacteria bacterium]|nr:FAD-dependent oxidoreductase [Alphaproteobacteria bacterium]